MGVIGPSLYLDQLIGKKEVQFDWGKFGWVGSTENTPWLFYMSSNTPFKTIEDVRKAKEAPKCSATSSGTSGHFIPKLLEEAVGAKFTVVMGYQGGAGAGFGFRARRSGLPRAEHPDFFCARAVYHVAQEKYGAHLAADRPQARSEDARRADHPRTDERIQNAGEYARSWSRQCWHRAISAGLLSRLRRFPPIVSSSCAMPSAKPWATRPSWPMLKRANSRPIRTTEKNSRRSPKKPPRSRARSSNV